MASIKKIFSCSNCDAQSPKWSGRCLECGSWGTLQEEIVDQKSKKESEQRLTVAADIISLKDVKEKNLNRFKTSISEFDRVLGGGLVPGSLILLSGEPGIGKSTLAAQIANESSCLETIYVSGEESAVQVKGRLERLKLNLNKFKFISETNVEKIIASTLKDKPPLIIIDSIQTVYSSMIPSEAGSVSQIRAATVKFLELAKENNITIILIGHITKDGQVAGPKSLEHIVDTVLYLEAEVSDGFCFLRSTKNRFGSVNELGVLEMTGSGFKEIKNPGSIFIETPSEDISGSVITCVIEGTRPFLADIQALVSKTVFGYPQRKSSGFDLNRLAVLSAVISKRTKINLTSQDIILNIAGGLKVSDPALDLAVCTSIISSYYNQSWSRGCIVLGEVGLGGELRPVSKLDARLKEAERLGFKQAIIPDTEIRKSGLKISKIKNLQQLVDIIK
ncbi:MAG: DNA repair protein RadA [Patescibacteria group bacterium]|jgi:DNA repair protein RadA/Sms|nr:DNA repair protein RadA [Patescibacteria group bacterium]